jgi:hypothetical protein
MEGCFTCNVNAHPVPVTRHRREAFNDEILTCSGALRHDVRERADTRNRREADSRVGRVHPLAHHLPKAASSSSLTGTTQTQRSPALRTSRPRIALPPGLKAGIPCEEQGMALPG